MNLKLSTKFTCPKCQQEFTISQPNLQKKTSISCPNCEEPFIKQNTELLQRGIQKLSQLKKNLPMENPEWKITIS